MVGRLYVTIVLSGHKSAIMSAGEPWEVKKAVCLHEEDVGILWKHMEY